MSPSNVRKSVLYLLFLGLVGLGAVALVGLGSEAESPMYAKVGVGSNLFDPGDTMVVEVHVDESSYGESYPIKDAAVLLTIQSYDPLISDWADEKVYPLDYTNSDGDVSYVYTIPTGAYIYTWRAYAEAEKDGYYDTSDDDTYTIDLDYLEMYSDYSGSSLVAPQATVEFEVRVEDRSESPYKSLSGAAVGLSVRYLPEEGPTEYVTNLTPFLSDSQGKATLTWTIPKNSKEGSYSLVVYARMGGYRIDYQSYSFTVKNWNLEVFTQTAYYLSNSQMVVFYSLSNVWDGSGVDKAEYSWRLYFEDYVGYPVYSYVKEEVDSDSFSSTSSADTFATRLPKDTNPGSYYLQVWANNSQLGRSAYALESFEVQNYLYVYMSMGGPYPYQFKVGDYVSLDISAEIGGYSPVVFADVKIEVTGPQGSEIKPYGGSGKTNLQGDYQHTFKILSSANAGDIYTISVNVSASDTVFSLESRTFEIVEAEEEEVGLTFSLQPRKESYAPGETVIVDYTLRKGADPVSTGYIYWRTASEYSSTFYLGHGRFATSLTDSFSFTIPTNFGEGYISVYGVASKADEESVTDSYSIKVNYNDLVILPEKEEYAPGETAKVNYYFFRTADGAMVEQATLYYEVYEDYYGQTIAEGELVNVNGKGSFTFTIPKEADDYDDYYIQVRAKDDQNRYSSDSYYLSVAGGYRLLVSFEGDRFNPGDTVKINYEFVPQGSAADFRYGLLRYGMSGNEMNAAFVTKSSGTVEYKIPEDSGTGELYFTVYGSVNDNGGTAMDVRTITVQEAKMMSSLNNKLFGVNGGSPLPLLALILAVVALGHSVVKNSNGFPSLGSSKLPASSKLENTKPAKTGTSGPADSSLPSSPPGIDPVASGGGAAAAATADTAAAGQNAYQKQTGGGATQNCPKCGQPANYVEQYQRHYCYTCAEYLP